MGFGLIAATALQIGGSLLAGRSKQKAAKRQAKFALLQGQIEEKQSRVLASEVRRKGAKLIASQISGFAAAGVDVNSGTPIDVYMDTAADVELEALSVLHAGTLAKISARESAKTATTSGGQAQTQSLLQAGGSLFDFFNR